MPLSIEFPEWTKTDDVIRDRYARLINGHLLLVLEIDKQRKDATLKFTDAESDDGEEYNPIHLIATVKYSENLDDMLKFCEATVHEKILRYYKEIKEDLESAIDQLGG